MKVLIVFAHPEPKSFNGALLEAAVETLSAGGHDVQVSDLYKLHFASGTTRSDFTTVADPDYLKYQIEEAKASTEYGFATDIAEQQRRVVWCDHLILLYPLYWFHLPGILKGWVDRVMAAGFAYGGGKWYETAPLYGRRALLAFTMGAPQDRWADDTLFGPLDGILNPIRYGILNFCGFEALEPFVVYAPARITDDARRAYLDRWRERLLGLDRETPLPFRRAADFGAGRYRGAGS